MSGVGSAEMWQSGIVLWDTAGVAVQKSNGRIEASEISVMEDAEM
jgi:hypothetical protein